MYFISECIRFTYKIKNAAIIQLSNLIPKTITTIYLIDFNFFHYLDHSVPVVIYPYSKTKYDKKNITEKIKKFRNLKLETDKL